MVNQQFATSIHILSSLGLNEGKLLSSEELAKSVRSNPVLIRTLVQKLNRAGLVETLRGKSGGIKIAKSPKEILLSDVYRCLEPQPAICKREKKGDKHCPVGRSMDGIVHDISMQIEGEIEKFLARRSIADVIADIR